MKSTKEIGLLWILKGNGYVNKRINYKTLNKLSMIDDLCHDFTSITFSEHVSKQEDVSLSDGASST